MLQDNVEGYRKEIASLREKDQKMAAAAQKSTLAVHTATQELKAVQEKLSMAKVGLTWFVDHVRGDPCVLVVYGHLMPAVAVSLRVARRACARRGTCC